MQIRVAFIPLAVQASIDDTVTPKGLQIEETDSEYGCPVIKPGMYTTSRGETSISLAVLNTTTMNLSFDKPWKLEDGVIDEAHELLIQGQISYKLYPNCMIEVIDQSRRSFSDLLSRLSEDIPSLSRLTGDSPFEYLPSVMSIRLGPLALTYRETRMRPLRPECESIHPGHYLHHIDGVTTVVRVIDDSTATLTLTLPSAARAGHESISSTLARYRLEPDCTMSLSLLAESDEKELDFIMRAFSKIGDAKVSTGSMEFNEENLQLRIGSLVLNIDSPVVFGDFHEFGYDECGEHDPCNVNTKETLQKESEEAAAI